MTPFDPVRAAFWLLILLVCVMSLMGAARFWACTVWGIESQCVPNEALREGALQIVAMVAMLVALGKK